MITEVAPLDDICDEAPEPDELANTVNRRYEDTGALPSYQDGGDEQEATSTSRYKFISTSGALRSILLHYLRDASQSRGFLDPGITTLTFPDAVHGCRIHGSRTPALDITTVPMFHEGADRDVPLLYRGRT